MIKADRSPGAKITVEVAYATADEQVILSLQVDPGTSAYQAASWSNICQRFPQIDLDKNPMGIFSQPLNGKGFPTPHEYRLRDGDRVEIYRPLLIDPKQARLQRAKDAKNK